MKSWEMIRELSENPKKKFKRKTDGLEIRSMCGRFNWEPGYTFLGVADEWEEIKESVSFLDVVRAGTKGYLISVKHEGMAISYQDWYFKPLMMELGKELESEEELLELIKNGEWYIED